MNAALTRQEKLKDLRVDNGLMLEQLEKRTGISKSAFDRNENHQNTDLAELRGTALE